MKKLNGFWRQMILPTIVLIWAAAYFIEVLAKGPKNVYLIKPVFICMVILYFINGYIDYRKYKLEQKIEQEKAENPDVLVATAVEVKTEDGTLEAAEVIAEKEAVVVAEEPKDWREKLKKSGAGRTIGLFLALAVYTAIIGIFGFFISTLLLIVSIFLIMGERNWKRIVIMAPLAVIAVYLIFKVGLKVPLPMGFFG